MKNKIIALVFVMLGFSVSHVKSNVLDFEDLEEGASLSLQYAGLGVTFEPNAFVGDGGPSGAWATNTDMTISASDLGALGSPLLVSGNVLHTYEGWFDEDGDPSFLITFSAAVNHVGADFAGVENGADVRMYIYDGSLLLAVVSGDPFIGTPRQVNLSYDAPSFTSVVVSMGSFGDWVGVDNISYSWVSDVPELSSGFMLLLGLSGVFVKSGGSSFVRAKRSSRNMRQ